MIPHRIAVCLLCYLGLASPFALGQDSATVEGVVQDITGARLVDALVTLIDEGQVSRDVTTDPDGSYRFDDVTPGTYELVASRAGFRSSVQDVIVEASSAVVVNHELQPAYTERVVVTVSRDDRRLLDTPASVTVIEAEDIETSAADNYGDLFRTVPGMNILQMGARDFNINARNSTGILSNSMLVMVDGRAVYQPVFGGVYWDLMPVAMDEIGSIEIVSTPASVLWGANAMTGVVNVRTKSPRDLQGFRVTVGAGEVGTLFASAVFAEARGDVAYKLSGSFYEQDAWERDNLLPDGSPLPPAVIFENQGTRQPKFDARVDWDLRNGRVFSLRGGVVGSSGLIFSSLGPSEIGDGSYSSYVDADYRSDAMDVKLYWNRLDGPFRLVLFGLDEDNVNDTIAVDLVRRHAAGERHRFTFGGTARVDFFDLTLTPDDTRRANFGAFIEDSITLHPDVQLILAGRVDKFDSTEAVFAPRIGAVYTPTSGQSIRFTYNRAFRAPSLLENFNNRDLPSVVPIDPPFVFFQNVRGSQDLSVEKLDSFEVGYRALIGNRTVFSATAYRQNITDLIRFIPVSFFGPGNPPPGWPLPPEFFPVLPEKFSFINFGTVRDQGVELGMQVQWPRIGLRASYAFKDRPDIETELNMPLELNRPSRHQGAAGLTYTRGMWKASADVTYTDRAFWADVFTEPFWGYTDSFATLNATFSIRPSNGPVTLRVTGWNLLDEAYKTHVYGDIIRRKVMAFVDFELE